MLALPLLRAGRSDGTMLRLAINQSCYQSIVEAAQREPQRSPHAKFDGMTYAVDVVPVRLAFHPEGFLYSCSGIIFDPAGMVMEW